MLVDNALSYVERNILVALWAAVAPVPSGDETAEGVPCALVWPATADALTDDGSTELDGWTIRELDAVAADDVADELRRFVGG